MISSLIHRIFRLKVVDWRGTPVEGANINMIGVVPEWLRPLAPEFRETEYLIYPYYRKTTNSLGEVQIEAFFVSELAPNFGIVVKQNNIQAYIEIEPRSSEELIVKLPRQ